MGSSLSIFCINFSWKYNKNAVSLDKILMRYEINFPDVWFSQMKNAYELYDVRQNGLWEMCIIMGFMDSKWSESDVEFTRDVKYFWTWWMWIMGLREFLRLPKRQARSSSSDWKADGEGLKIESFVAPVQFYSLDLFVTFQDVFDILTP